MTISEKAKEKLEDASKEIKTAIENLGEDVSELTRKVKEKLKGTGEDIKETAEELTKEVKELSERVKNMVPKRKKKQQLPVRVERYPSLDPGHFDCPFLGRGQDTDRLFDAFFRNADLSFRRWGGPLSVSRDAFSSQWPRADMTETEDAIHIIAELPGVNKDNLGVSVSDGSITINGEKREEEEDKGLDYYWLERSYGSFRRTFDLPCEIDLDQVDASFKDGVLNIELPKTETARKRIKKIPVKSS